MAQHQQRARSAAPVDPFAVLASSQYLSPLSDADRESLAQIAVVRHFEAGDEILPQAEMVKCFYVVASGRVKMLRAMPNGRQVVLALFGQGQLFGTVDAIGRQPSRGSLLALTDEVCCLQIGREPLFRLLEQHADLATRLLVAFTPHVSECTNCLVELACLPIEARLALLLLKLATSAGYEKNGELFVPIALSRQELADMTGTTIETCIRIMSRWGKDGVVETRDNGFAVHDPATLSRLSAG